MLFQFGLSCSLFKYANDSTLIIPVWKNGDVNTAANVVDRFTDWTNTNCMKCNFSKCKELAIRKKGYHEVLDKVQNIPQHPELSFLGVTFQENFSFSIHVKNKLIAANKQLNKCLYVLRTLRKEGYSQEELDKLFSTIVKPKLTYGISVYGSSPPELTTVQCFLDRCYKRRYTSSPISILERLEKSDKCIFKKLCERECHPLFKSLPRTDPATLKLRKVERTFPICKTERFKNSFINRLSFNCNLAINNSFLCTTYRKVPCISRTFFLKI